MFTSQKVCEGAIERTLISMTTAESGGSRGAGSLLRSRLQPHSRENREGSQ